MNPYGEDANEPMERPHTPSWVPGWCPAGDTLDYMKRALTVAFLVIVSVYLLTHLARGRSASAGASLAATAT